MTLRIITEITESTRATGFITVYKPIAGWKAVQYWWNPHHGGFWEPWQTGDWAFDTKEKAILDAKFWAEFEDIPYYPGKETK